MSDSSPGASSSQQSNYLGFATASGQYLAGFVPAVGPLPTRYRILTFSAGFLCGQASLIVIAILFLRYVVFEDPKVAMREAGKRRKKRLRNLTTKRQRRTPSNGRKQTAVLNVSGSVPTSDGQILKKLGYDLSVHAGESADWLNVLVAQAVSAYRAMILASSAAAQASALDSSDDEDADDQDDAVSGGRNVKRYVEHALNAARGAKEKQSSMVTLDYIRVTEFDFGQDFPVVSNARVRPSNESGKVRIEVDIDYTDHLSLGIETKVLINFPKPRFAIIPVSLALALARFSATLTLEIPPTGIISATAIDALDSSPMPALPASASGSALSVSIHPDFILELATTSLIGSRAKLQDIPKVEQLIVGRVRAWVIENLVWPKVRTFKLPTLSQRKFNTASASQNEQYEAPPATSLRPPTGADSPSSPSEADSSAERQLRESTVDSVGDILSPETASVTDDADDNEADEIEISADISTDHGTNAKPSMPLRPVGPIITPPSCSSPQLAVTPRNIDALSANLDLLQHDRDLRPYARGVPDTRTRRRCSLGSSADEAGSSAISSASSDVINAKSFVASKHALQRTKSAIAGTVYSTRSSNSSGNYRDAYRDALRRSSSNSASSLAMSETSSGKLARNEMATHTPRPGTPLMSPGLGIAATNLWPGTPLHSLAGQASSLRSSAAHNNSEAHTPSGSSSPVHQLHSRLHEALQQNRMGLADKDSVHRFDAGHPDLQRLE